MFKSIRIFFIRYAFTVSIVIVALLIVQNALMTFYGEQALKKKHETEQAYREVNEMLDASTLFINLMDLGLRGIYMMKKENFAEPYDIAMEQYEDNFISLENKLQELDYPHMDQVETLKEQTERYAGLITRGINYVKSEQYEEAVRLFESDPGFELYTSSRPIIESIEGYITNMNVEATARYNRIKGYTTASQIFTVALGIPVLIIALIRIIRQERRILKLFKNLKESNQRYIYKENGTSKSSKNILKQGLIIEKIVANLKKASSFIQNITKGNLDVKWEGMDEQARAENSGTIAGQLLQMRDQLIEVKKAEEKRQWITEGVANFSDLVREYKEDFDTLSKKVISFLVKYTNSNQGGLYILNDTEDEDFLELTSLYAYDKQKFENQRIPIGVGLIGEAFREGEIALYKDIPDNYINITSGLGEALPRNLIIVPIKTDEKKLGALEMASFELYEEHHIEFLERISLTLGSEVASSKTNVLTKKLLQASKENEEIMRSQEEEMRQNMEELQATQEELERQKKELLDKIAILEEKLAQK
ncbi:GAF domain-containing protein [Mangrovivirga sp. M17]|uniref:GAF domain-containing protein n=1 Tax=Mangrovivirga halotolerans TaxID=2993936 RepID=A0ABT3RWI9_9BACT|nr:GAF domain-containing protein [Mangrovivirga halotolerans]MCX2745597.1 GAF domain-containing protein [Mangrovivirga halotolerans]